jgi:tetratricopeptide (TPR) repeat protein
MYQKRSAAFMRWIVAAAVFLLACPIAVAQFCHRIASPAPGDEFRQSPCCKVFAEPDLDPRWQKVKWEVTGKPEARLYFRQGMTQYYGFNYEEALRNFRMAKKVDGAMAMASWGMALAAGPNINLGMDRNCHDLAKKESKSAVEKARTQPGITPLERTLIDALPLRYDYTDPADAMKAQKAYSEKLGQTWNDFQRDPNYGALYAESIVELHPWDLYRNRVPTSDDTDKVIGVLKAAMAADPDAVGANHYWIHVVEAGPTPVIGLPSANLLQTLVPASGHLVHMPSHIYLLTGAYDRAVTSNKNAAGADLGEYKACCSGPYLQYSNNPYCPNLYYGHYLSHNFFFGSVSATFGGQSRMAIVQACDTRAHAQNFLVNEPGLQRYMTAPLLTLVANRNWGAIVAYPPPPEDCYNQPPFKPTRGGCVILNGMWHWARGMEFAARGDKDLSKQQLDEMGRAMDRVGMDTWGNNRAWDVMNVGRLLLQAHHQWISSQSKADALTSLQKAVDQESKLTYDEPPQWFPTARESLGGAHLVLGNYAQATKAFAEELKLHPGSGRALYGNMRALQRLPDKQKEAAEARIAFCDAWKNADYMMNDQNLWAVQEAGTDPGVTCPWMSESKPLPVWPSGNTCGTPAWPPQLWPGCPTPKALLPTDCSPVAASRARSAKER